MNTGFGLGVTSEENFRNKIRRVEEIVCLLENLNVGGREKTREEIERSIDEWDSDQCRFNTIKYCGVP